MEMQFQGLDELMLELEGMERDTEKSKKDALEAGGKVMQTAAKSIAPVRAVGGGTLKANIEISDIENDQIEVFVDNQGKAYYGYMLEVGTSKMPAQPFMGPAFNQSRIRIEQAMANSIRNSLRSFI
ncbi:HK97 gp10 family phage protein [Oceanobacillus kimchii]|uniref:HK97-gp10 family putative phage morphogenesis protein n=1 Tax=Oceanobacillus kimchii TaxID=746691 RepID=UPI0021A3D885|nr:HK97-gp10 family putative phage morphogenesis protein [Oceanobacillus kimchii]MCT1575698.1 HK97 gp10 family phage protein [Oceanobacillus kimchii]MCT2137328.1 HK97 gp10 family phage protein [Oceanobacillus kimchii]